MDKSKAFVRGYVRAFGEAPSGEDAEVVEEALGEEEVAELVEETKKVTGKADVEVKRPKATLPSEEAMAAVAEEEAASEEE